LTDLLALPFGHAELPADHLDRKRIAEIGHRVKGPGPVEGGEGVLARERVEYGRCATPTLIGHARLPAPVHLPWSPATVPAVARQLANAPITRRPNERIVAGGAKSVNHT